MIRVHFLESDGKDPALIQVPEQSACEFDFTGEPTVDPRQLLLFRIDPHRAFKMVEDFLLTAVRDKLWIWFECQFDQISFCTRILVAERIGKGRKHAVLPRGVLTLFLPVSSDFAAVSEEFLDTRIFTLLLVGR